MRMGGDEVEWRMLAARTLSEASSGTLIDVGYPTTAESARLSPTRPAAVPQDHLETILIKYLRTLPDAHVDLGVAVEDIRPTANGYGLRIRTEASGTDRLVEAGYLIGADGPRSVVRQCLGVGVRSTEEVLHLFSGHPGALVGGRWSPPLRDLRDRETRFRHVSARGSG
jgi:2-polyprenyl-6-methoxyphenol hydroxylase-like FAD-dependent oxidoreductase